MIDLLIQRAAAIGIEMTLEQAEKFKLYHELLIDRNHRLNLTAVSEDINEAIDRNYLDCISALKFDDMKEVETMIDVGSGAGFPGIPLAIMCPHIRFTLLDALGKRVDFLNEVIDRLGLNAIAIHARAEDGARRPELRERFDIATARAVAAVNLLSEYLMPFVKVGGRMLLYKGPNAGEELEQAQNALEILGGGSVNTSNVEIPNRDWEHRIVYIKKERPTPDKYPRRAGKPEKKPL